MEHNMEKIRELAERIYDLDAEVYTQLGSSLGQCLTGTGRPVSRSFAGF